MCILSVYWKRCKTPQMTDLTTLINGSFMCTSFPETFRLCTFKHHVSKETEMWVTWKSMTNITHSEVRQYCADFQNKMSFSVYSLVQIYFTFKSLSLSAASLVFVVPVRRVFSLQPVCVSLCCAHTHLPEEQEVEKNSRWKQGSKRCAIGAGACLQVCK